MAAPYRTLNEYLVHSYNERTYRLTVTGGKTCPTRDGTFGPKKGWGGCTFCDVYGSASFHSLKVKHLGVTEQLEAAAEGIRKRFRATKFIPYFQSYTTSIDEIAQYQEWYQLAAQFPNVVALAVATRPDCVPDQYLEMLLEFTDQLDVFLELGIQTFHEPTLDWFDRGHDGVCSIDAIRRIQKMFASKSRQHRLDIVAHIIIGSPLEMNQDMIRNAEILNELGVEGVKVHHLHILTKTKLAAEYRKSPFPLLSLKEYEEQVSLFLRHLDPKIIIHRTHATAPRADELVGPAWSNMRAYPSQQLRMRMERLGETQGDLLSR